MMPHEKCFASILSEHFYRFYPFTKTFKTWQAAVKGEVVIPVKSHPKFDKRVKLKINVREGAG